MLQIVENSIRVICTGWSARDADGRMSQKALMKGSYCSRGFEKIARTSARVRSYT